MRRLFPIVAALIGLLLMAGFYSGLIGLVDEFGRRLRIASTASALGVHAWVFLYLWATGRHVEAVVERSGLPGWVGAQAEKNRRKGLVFEVAGSLMAIAGMGVRAGDWWYPVVEGSSVSFQVGSFLGEAAIVAGQSRLLEGLREWSGQGRAAEVP